jgi:hypothetical protein
MKIIQIECLTMIGGHMAGLIKQILKGALATRPNSVSSVSAKPGVSLAPFHRPARTRVEQIAVAVLVREEEVPLSELAALLAEALYRDELRNGGWAADLGLLGSGVFLADALHEIKAGDGCLWNIVRSDGGQ